MRVTCVMPTTEGRRGFWPRAVRCFLSQTYADAELLVLVETQDRRPFDSVPGERVRFVRMDPAALATGAKRNLVNGMAGSELICHWDDDDWYHPDRLARQVSLLDATGQEVVGYHDLLYWREGDRSLWAYYYQGRKPYATGTSMLYRRRWWEGHRFPGDKSVGEDTDFWREAASAGALASTGRELGYPNIHMIVATSHGSNTYRPQFGAEPFVGATRDMFPDQFLKEVGL